MDELVGVGLGFLLLGVLMTYFSYSKIKKFRKEKYNPFKDKSKGIFRLMNAEVYYKTYGAFILGILSILLSIILIFFVNE